MHVQFDSLSKEHKVGAVKSLNYVSQKDNPCSTLQRCLYFRRFPGLRTGERDLSRWGRGGGGVGDEAIYQETYMYQNFYYLKFHDISTHQIAYFTFENISMYKRGIN